MPGMRITVESGSSSLRAAVLSVIRQTGEAEPDRKPARSTDIAELQSTDRANGNLMKFLSKSSLMRRVSIVNNRVSCVYSSFHRLGDLDLASPAPTSARGLRGGRDTRCRTPC